MLDWIRSWSPLGVANQYVLGGFLAALAVIVGLGVLRALFYIRHYGFWNWLKSSFRVENETWRLIGILLFVAMAMAMLCIQHA